MRCSVFLLFVAIAVCHGKNSEPPKDFSDTYNAKGTLYIPFAEIREPFYAWYDGKKSKSRIDYYGGMVKTFQLPEYYKIVPVTTDEAQNVDTCFYAGLASKAQSILPDVSNFEYAGEDMINGLPCYKWTLTTKIEDKVNRYTLWTRSKKSLGEDTVIPVRYEMKGYNTLLGSHYDHYYLDYEWFSPKAPSNDVFEISNYTCKTFIGPPENHIYTFNPMKEFVENHDSHVQIAFENFKKTHDKKYVSKEEHDSRMDVFRHNLRFIHSHNRAGKSFQLGVNHLADKNDLELKVLRGNRYSKNLPKAKPFPYTKEKVKEIVKDLPESLDWRINGAVTPVKDQSVCGSCWSFGSTGAIESAYFLKHGFLKRFSQQALIDCSWENGNNGCDGGEDSFSFDWIIKHGGIPTEEDYGPYLGQDGYCHINKSLPLTKIKQFFEAGNTKEEVKASLAVHGPLSIAIDASPKTFSFYSSGVYYDLKCNSTLLNHAVLLVGYGKLNGEDYWLVKNSWSTYWGNDGYILISLKDNVCGVLNDPNYVTL